MNQSVLRLRGSALRTLTLAVLLWGGGFRASAIPTPAEATPSAGSTTPDAAGTPAGHWEGDITLPTTKLGIRVDLERSTAGAWSGTIDIPVQALRGFKLGQVTVENRAISFLMPGIPGDPRFEGSLGSDRKTITGQFSQGGIQAPFRLERKPKREMPNQTPTKGIPGRGLVGTWQGSLTVRQVMELRLVLHVNRAADGSLAGTMDSIDQGATSIPISAISEARGSVRIEIRKIGGEFTGKISDDGSEIAGDWKQGGQTLPLTWKRLAQAPDTARPQDPKKPYPYDEHEVTIENQQAGLTLAGTLTIPRGAGPHPAAILLSGSGPQDRNEAIMGHRPFLVLADHLTRQGIAVLRFDDRGVGQSTGQFSQATHEDFVEDALAALAFLRRRPEVDARRIGFIGHSEGGITAPIAALRAPDVAFLVLLAGVGVPTDQLLERQSTDILRQLGTTQEIIDRSTRQQQEVFGLIKEGRSDEEVRARVRTIAAEQIKELTEEQQRALGITEATIEGQTKTVLSPWFKKLLVYDPRPTLKQVRCPVLAINGDKDIQVAAGDNLRAIREALAAGGNTRVVTRELPGLNHLFQPCQTGAVAEYGQIEVTFAPEALTTSSDWLLELWKEPSQR